MNPIDKYSKLCDDPPSAEGTRLAFFKGSLRPDVLIVGEAPGPDENIAGVPFVGRSGRLVEDVTARVGLDNFEIAFLNPVFRMPPGINATFRKPTREEIEYYRPMAQEIRTFLAPRYTILMGATAREAIFAKSGEYGVRGAWIGSSLLTYHPGFILRNPGAIKSFEQDIRSVVVKLELDDSNKSIDAAGNINFQERHQVKMDLEKIKAISEKSEIYGKELELIRGHVSSDPNASIIKSRKVLEMMLAEHLPHHVRTLSDQIKELSGTVPEHIESSMHFIRRNGNTAAHSSEQLNSSFARQNFEVLLSLFCWQFQIDADEIEAREDAEPKVVTSHHPDQHMAIGGTHGPMESNTKVRFFIANAIYKTWPKIAVLTEDGTLYSEYLAWNEPTVFKRSGLDFNTFEAKDFFFGGEEHGSAYQPIREVSYRDAISFELTRQSNWVNNYLIGRGTDLSTLS